MRKGIGPQNLGAPGSSPITKNYSPLKKLSDPGDKYKKGDLIDETDHEEQVYSTTNKNEYSDKPGAGLNVENISEIQEDKKGQYMTTLDEKEFIGTSKYFLPAPSCKPRSSDARDSDQSDPKVFPQVL